jgi:hypothetical protein
VNLDHWKQIDDIVIESTTDLFGAFGVSVHQAPDEGETPIRTLAMMGFGGDHLRGTLLLDADASVIAQSYPTPDAVRPEDLDDWLAELANQLLGRVKNRLLRHGIVIQMSTPTVVSGRAFRIGVLSGSEACMPHRFEGAGGGLSVRFEATANAGVALESPARDIAAEGDMLLF